LTQKKSDFKDFSVLWKDSSLVGGKETRPESTRRGEVSCGTGSKSARRQKSSGKTPRDKTKSGIPEELMEIYGFLKQKDSLKKVSLSKIMLNRQESAPFLLKDKISQVCQKGISSSKSKRSIDKSAPGDKTKRHSRSITGKKLVF
jgi:hypothetical protein